jgi:hypothetical protein
MNKPAVLDKEGTMIDSFLTSKLLPSAEETRDSGAESVTTLTPVQEGMHLRP